MIIIAIESDTLGNVFLSGDLDHAATEWSGAYDEEEDFDRSQFTVQGAGWSTARPFDNGNALLAYTFTTSRVFATFEEAMIYKARVPHDLAYEGTAVKRLRDSRESTPTWLKWTSENAVVKLTKASNRGVSIDLTFTALLPGGWTQTDSEITGTNLILESGDNLISETSDNLVPES